MATATQAHPQPRKTTSAFNRTDTLILAAILLVLGTILLPWLVTAVLAVLPLLIVATAAAAILFAIAPSHTQARVVLVVIGLASAAVSARMVSHVGTDARAVALGYIAQRHSAALTLLHGAPHDAPGWLAWSVGYARDTWQYGLPGGLMLAGIGATFLWPSRERSRGRFPVPVSLDTGSKGSGQAEAVEEEGIRTAVAKEPPPRTWTVAGLVPAGYVTLLYSPGGLGKSTLAQWLAQCVAIGQPFVGLPCGRGAVLTLDGELDRHEWTRRAFAVARGAGLERPPNTLYYYRLPGLVTDPAVQERIRGHARRCRPWWAFWRPGRPALIVLDSLTIAGGLGATATDAQVREVFEFLRSLVRGTEGAVVAIDHVTKASSGNPREATPFASVFKWNHSRSVVLLTPAEEAAAQARADLELVHRKSNFGALLPPLLLAVDRQQAPASFAYRAVEGPTPTSREAPRKAPKRRPPTAEKVLPALQAAGTGGALVSELAISLHLSPKSVSNALTELAKVSRVEPAGAKGEGRWRLR